MLVAEILKGKGDAVYAIAPDITLKQACQELATKRVGALMVCDSDRVVGVFSERDVVRAVAQDGPEALDTAVSHYMTREVVFAQPAETVAILMERMTDRRIRHLPVCERGRLVGIVSIGDLVKWKITEVEAEAEGLKAYIAAG